MMHPKQILSIALFSFALAFYSASGEPTASIEWKAFQETAKIEIGRTTLKVQGTDIPAITARIPASQSSFTNALVIPIEEATKGSVQTVSFRVKVPEGASRAITIALFGKSWYLKDVDEKPLPLKKFTEASPEYIDDELEFTWDIGPLLASAEDTDIRQIVFIYPTNELPEGTAVTLTLSEVTFR